MFFVSCDLIFVTDVTIWQCPRQQFVENNSCEIDLNEPLLGHPLLSNLEKYDGLNIFIHFANTFVAFGHKIKRKIFQN